MLERTPMYFGCHKTVGHYLIGPNGQKFGRDKYNFWAERLDGVLPPQDTQEQGLATLSSIHGYSIISFWDRSVDHRGQSNSNFFMPGDETFNEALELSKAWFPEIFERFKFDIREYEENA